MALASQAFCAVLGHQRDHVKSAKQAAWLHLARQISESIAREHLAQKQAPDTDEPMRYAVPAEAVVAGPDGLGVRPACPVRPRTRGGGTLIGLPCARSVDMIRGNLFTNVPHQLSGEQVEELLSTPNVRIERIVSIGHATAPDEWYDQDRAEWVLLLAGSAGLVFEGETAPLRLEPGSYVHIPAHKRHRVAWADGSGPTIWLAIHYQ